MKRYNILYLSIIWALVYKQGLSFEKFQLRNNMTFLNKNISNIVFSSSECAMRCLLIDSCCGASLNGNVCWMALGCSCEFRISDDSVALLKLTTVSENQGCPCDWEGFNLSCFYFSETKETWDDALDICKSKGAYLAEVNSNEEIDFLGQKARTTTRTSFWVAGTDRQLEGAWIWETSKAPLTVNDWITDEPNNRQNSQHCLVITYRGWDDTRCGSSYNYICEMNSVSVNLED